MGSLGNVGYGAYNIKGTLLVVGPEGAQVLKRRSTLDELLDLTIEEAQEDDIFLDHRINTGGI